MARMATASAELAAVTALAVAGVAQRAAVAASFTVLGHLHWLWFPAALLLESASMAAFAIMLRRLLAAGGASVGIRPMLARGAFSQGASAGHERAVSRWSISLWSSGHGKSGRAGWSVA
jgi:hypothetical protein